MSRLSLSTVRLWLSPSMSMSHVLSDVACHHKPCLCHVSHVCQSVCPCSISYWSSIMITNRSPVIITDQWPIILNAEKAQAERLKQGQVHSLPTLTGKELGPKPRHAVSYTATTAVSSHMNRLSWSKPVACLLKWVVWVIKILHGPWHNASQPLRRPGINTDPGRRWQTVDCTWTLSLGHFLNLKKNFKFKFKCVLKLKLSHSCLELELLNLLLTHTHRQPASQLSLIWFDDQWSVIRDLWSLVGTVGISWNENHTMSHRSWVMSLQRTSTFFPCHCLVMLWYGSLSHGMQRIGTLGVWTKAWSIVSFYESSTQLVSPGFLTIGHQHLVTVSRLFKFKFLQGTPGYG